MSKLSINENAESFSKKKKLTKKSLGTRIIAGGLALFSIAALTTKASSVKLKDETLEITQGIDIFHDNKYLVPVNEEGEKIESFIYDDVTYVPAETLAEMFGHSISWNERKKTLCIDKTEKIDSNETYCYEEVSDKENTTFEASVKTGIRLYVKDELGEERVIPKDEEEQELPIILFNDIKYLPISIVPDVFEEEITWNEQFEGINIGVYDEEVALKGTDFIVEETQEPVTTEPPKPEVQEPIVEEPKEEVKPEVTPEPEEPVNEKDEPIVPEQPKENPKVEDKPSEPIEEPKVEQPKVEQPKVEQPKEEPKIPETDIEKPVEVVPPKEETPVIPVIPPKQEVENPVVEQPKEEVKPEVTPEIEEPVKVDKQKPSNVDANVWKYYQDYLYCLDYLEPYSALINERIIAFPCMTADVGVEYEKLNLDLSDPVLKKYNDEYTAIIRQIVIETSSLRLAWVEGSRQMHQALFQRVESGTYTTFDRDVLKQTSELLLKKTNELEQDLINTSPEAMERYRSQLLQIVEKMAEYQKSKTLILK